MKIKLFIFIFISIFPAGAFTQSFLESHITRISKSLVVDFNSLGVTWGTALLSPLKWNAKDWGTVAAVTGTSVFLYQNKEKNRDWFYFDRLNVETGKYEPQPKTAFEKMYLNLSEVSLGNAGILFSSSYLLSQLFNLSVLSKLSFELMESSLISGGGALLGAYIFSERRPSDGGEMKYFSPRGHGISGHSTFFASLSGPLNKYISSVNSDDSREEIIAKYVAKGVIYGVPLLIGYSRLRQEFSHNYATGRAEPSHYVWNVFLGLSLGYAVGEFVARQ